VRSSKDRALRRQEPPLLQVLWMECSFRRLAPAFQLISKGKPNVLHFLSQVGRERAQPSSCAKPGWQTPLRTLRQSEWNATAAPHARSAGTKHTSLHNEDEKSPARSTQMAAGARVVPIPRRVFAPALARCA
jgi:hypothetical protein